jgi:hypothetical protein
MEVKTMSVKEAEEHKHPTVDAMLDKYNRVYQFIFYAGIVVKPLEQNEQVFEYDLVPNDHGYVDPKSLPKDIRKLRVKKERLMGYRLILYV